MSVAATRGHPYLTLPQFLGFLESRPDEERWELIEGVPMMMPPPKIAHQRIASNLERHLYNALRIRKPQWRADREIGLVLDPLGDYRPEPVIAVVDADIDTQEMHAGRFYLVAEVLSPSDERKFAKGDKTVIETKLKFYKAHEHNRCVMLIRQDAMEVTLHLRQPGGGWPDEPLVLKSGDDVIEIDEIGRICAVRDLYEGISLREK